MNTPLHSSRRQQAVLIGGICIASFAGCLDFTIVNTALPAIQRQFPAGLDSVQWVMTLFVMALCCCMVLATRLAERFGKPQVLTGGMLLFALASTAAGLAPSLPVLIVSRLLQGAGCAVLYTATAAILVDAIPESRRGRALGLLFAANGLGLTLGPVAGGLLVSLADWRAVFLINLPLMVISYLCCRGRMPASDGRREASLDLAGWFMLTAGLVPLLLWSVYVERWGLTSASSLLMLLAAAGFLTALVLFERRAPQPLISFRVLANRAFRRACWLSVLLAVFYCAAFLLMPFKLLSLYPLSAAQLGLMLLPVTLVMALTSPLAGKLADRYGPWPVLAGGFLLLAVSAGLQSRFADPQPASGVVIAFICMGAGWGAILGPSVAAALGALPTELHGQGIGLSWTLHNLGGTVGLAVATQIYQQGGAVVGYQWVMWTLAGLSLLGVLLATLSWHSIRRERADAGTVT